MIALDTPAADASPWVQQERRGFARLRGAARVTQRRVEPGPADVAAAVGPKAAAAREVRQARAVGEVRAARAVRRAREAREALATRSRAEFTRWFAAPGPPRRVEFDDARAWLAAGRIELRRVAGSACYVATEPLSNALYREFVRATGIAPPPTWARDDFAGDDLPVTGITWYEAAACASYFGGTLPDEASWLDAARSSPLDQRHATASGDLDPTLAHYGAPFACGAPRPARAHAPNAAGFVGMAGNTWDWCADPWGAEGADAHRVIRGGGWMDGAGFCHTGARYRNAPIDRDACVGLRLAWRPPRR
jgi:formylglycine-generating enzyme required for sulfatase activity